MKIRLAILDDHRVCAEIHIVQHGRPWLTSRRIYTPRKRPEWMRDVVFQSESVWVAEHADRIVGYALGRR